MNDLLPIGSIIRAEGIDVMICAYMKKDSILNNEHYDYACCKYPEGLSENAILVKKDKIERVKFIGFQDNQFVEFKNKLEKEND